MQRGGTWLAGMSMTGALYLSSVKKVISLLLSLCFSYTPHTLTLSVTRCAAPSCYVLLKRQELKDGTVIATQQRQTFRTDVKLLLTGIRFRIFFLSFVTSVSHPEVGMDCMTKGTPLLCSAALALYVRVCSHSVFIHFLVACVVEAIKPHWPTACQQPCQSNSF